DKERGLAALALIDYILHLVDNFSGEAYEAARSFLLHMAWHEGARLAMRVQAPLAGAAQPGPARSFWQLEAFVAREAWEYLSKFVLDGSDADDVAASMVAVSTDLLTQAFAQIPLDVTQPYFPH